MTTLNPFAALMLSVLNLVWMGIFIWFVLSLLIQFDVVNRYNPLVSRVYNLLERLIDPLLRPIRRVIPLIAGIDLSPVVLILLLEFIRNSIIFYSV